MSKAILVIALIAFVALMLVDTVAAANFIPNPYGGRR